MDHIINNLYEKTNPATVARFIVGAEHQLHISGVGSLFREHTKVFYNWPFNKSHRLSDFFFIPEDAKGTLSLMPEFKVRERALLESLHRFGMTEEGCIHAWFSFPHSMRIFYIHAYSSKVWNEAVSYRLSTYGSRVLAGDLVCLDEGGDDEHFPSRKVSTISSKVCKSSYYSRRTNFQEPLF